MTDHNPAMSALPLKRQFQGGMPICEDEARDVWNEMRRMQAEIDEFRAALEPFAKAAEIRLCGDWRDDEKIQQTDVPFYITFGDLRRARSAVQP